MNIAHATMALASLSLTAFSADAATIFETSETGNASALDGVGAGSVTPLTLSPADGGGTINLTTVDAKNGTNPQNMNIIGTAFGVGNQRWGNSEQRWLFSFDQDVTFDAVGFRRSNQGIRIQSAAWKDDLNTSGGSGATSWAFTSNGTFGQFQFFTGDGTDKVFDFTSAGVSTVSAGEVITIRHFSGAGGAEMQSFTITPATVIPSPSAAVLGLVGLGGLAMRRRRG